MSSGGAESAGKTPRPPNRPLVVVCAALSAAAAAVTNLTGPPTFLQSVAIALSVLLTAVLAWSTCHAQNASKKSAFQVAIWQTAPGTAMTSNVQLADSPQRKARCR